MPTRSDRRLARNPLRSGAKAPHATRGLEGCYLDVPESRAVICGTERRTESSRGTIRARAGKGRDPRKDELIQRCRRRTASLGGRALRPQGRQIGTGGRGVFGARGVAARVEDTVPTGGVGVASPSPPMRDRRGLGMISMCPLSERRSGMAEADELRSEMLALETDEARMSRMEVPDVERDI